MKGLKVLIVGCGDIGIAMATPLLAQGVEVWGLRRDCSKLPAGIQGISADVTDPASLAVLAGHCFDAVVVTLTPGEFSETAYQQIYVQGLSNLLSVLPREPLQRLIYVSSTSVYHQGGGEWVDEDSPALASSFSGRTLLAAETLLAGSGVVSTVVRFAGIYGPGRRRLIEQVRNGQGCPKQPVMYTNRIHRDDCAGFLVHLLEMQARGEEIAPLYLGVDSEPVPMWTLKQWLAGELGVAPDQLQETATGRRSSKRCSNQRMLASGYRLLYPGYRQGYGALLQQEP